MALAIKSIPVLRDKEAAKFIRTADANFKKKGSVDFSKKVSAASKILKKAQLK